MSLPGFLYRPQQHRMATIVAEAIENSAHLIVEAPTGVGKSLAYLVPAALQAIHENCTAIISTHTKTLQEQLLQHDIPRLRGAVGPAVTATTLKGRRNYLCLRRLASIRGGGMLPVDDDIERALQAIEAWARVTRDGDVEHLGFRPPPDVWDLVCSERGTCSPSACGTGCYHRRAWDRARQSALVIMNHALLFQLFLLRGTEGNIVAENEILVLDEAHTLEAAAGTGFGKRLSRTGLLQAIRRLYHPRRRSGLLAKRTPRGIRSACTALERDTREFFRSLSRTTATETAAGGARALRHVRLREPVRIDRSLLPALGALADRVRDHQEESGDAKLAGELGVAARALQEAKMFLEEALDVANESRTYWIEVEDNGEALCAAPRDPAEILGPNLFREGRPVILTSATLSVGGDLSYIRNRLGAPSSAQGHVLDSPFDLRSQMHICVVPDVPEPETSGYPEALAHWILASIRRTRGRALVLFTSAVALQRASRALTGPCQELGIPLLVQGAGRERHDLLDEFRRDVDSVLLGLDSFWSGVDVPGPALEQVIITRLPFAVPNHPVVEARLEDVERRGGNPFWEATLPEAVLKFRQGAGRLIRSHTDRGFVTILDSRVVRRPYGRAFLSSLPPCRIEMLLADGSVEEVLPDFW